nr:RHS repeat-associated core domain-containing protein [Photorhabdus akhurstii]
MAGEVQTQYAVSAPTGEPLALFDPAGKRVWRRPKQSLYGLRLGGQAENPQLDPGLRFAGQLWDEESGLCYNRHRFYSPEAACYLSPDPTGLWGGENPYAYVENPTGWVDPLGLSSKKCIPNKVAGTAREKRAQAIFEKRYGKENVINERYLRDANGKSVKDPLTGERRRIDFVIKGQDGKWSPVEITSQTAPKVGQLAKEQRIQQAGGTFVRNPNTRELIEINDISKVIRAR